MKLLRTSLILMLGLAMGSYASAQSLLAGVGTATLDGVLDAGEWTNTPLVTAMDVTFQAMADGQYFYMMAQWADPTESIAKNTWTFDGSTWTKSGNEDRLGIVWDMGQNGSDGAACGTMCHGDGLMRTNNGIVDVWHWKAARGSIIGFADDKYWDVDDRHGDAGTSAASNNSLDGAGLPSFMASGDPGVNAAFLGDNAATMALFAVSSHVSAEAVAFDASLTFSNGDTVPGYVLRTPAGDRASVEVAAKWDNGIWTLELKRAYGGTEHDFEVVKGASVGFTYEIFDNTGSAHPNDGMDLTVYTLDLMGIPVATAVEPIFADLPSLFVLEQNYPNPFNPSTQVTFLLFSSSEVEVSVFDMLGRPVKSLFKGHLPMGVHQVEFDASGLPSGVYLYTVRAGGDVQTRTMTLVK